MKKKLTVNTVALGNLKQRKKQYTVLIIGIILAIIFSSGTMFFISTTMSSNEEYRNQSYGKFTGYYFAPQDFVDAEAGKKGGYLESYGYAHILGYGYTDEEKTDRGAAIAWLDDEAKELYYVNVKEGRYPENKGEIAIEDDAARRLGIKSDMIGEKVTLAVFGANGLDYLSKTKQKTYTLVGILKDKRSNLGELFDKEQASIIPAAFVSDKEDTEAGEKEILGIYFKGTEETLNKRTSSGETVFWANFIAPIYDKAAAKYGENYSNPMIYTLIYSDNSSGDVMNSALITITFAVVLMLASCMGIINAFSTNLNERRKQIGMLRAVGATRRQIINIFGRETFIITLICTPIGVLISYFAVKLYAYFMGEQFIFIPNFEVLIGTAAVSVVCVMLASLIPLVSASKVSPMQAIRNVELSRKMKKQKIKTKKRFSVPKLLSSRSIKFYRSKQIGVTVILIITIFISSFGFSALKAESDMDRWNQYNKYEYSLGVTSGFLTNGLFVNMPNVVSEITANDYHDVVDSSMFTSFKAYKELSSWIEVDKYDDYMKILSTSGLVMPYYNNGNELTKEILDNTKSEDFLNIYFKKETEDYTKLKKALGTGELFHIGICGFMPEMIKENMDRFEVIDGKINIDKLNSGEEVVLVAYQNISYACTFDDDGRILSYGVQNLDDSDSLKDYSLYGPAASLSYKVGDTIKLQTPYSNQSKSEFTQEIGTYSDKISTCYEKEVKIGAIIKKFYFSQVMSMNSFDNIGIMTTTDGLSKISKYNHGYSYMEFDYDGELDDNTDEKVMEYLNDIFSGTDFSAFSNYAYRLNNQSEMNTLILALLSIVILMFAICASIVNNALTGKIRESKKEIGTLRAVGASVKDLTEAYIRQLVSMFAWGMGIGLGGYTVAHLVLKFALKDGYEMKYLIWPSLVICVLLCLICSLNLYFKIKQEMKHSIVENIREL